MLMRTLLLYRRLRFDAACACPFSLSLMSFLRCCCHYFPLFCHFAAIFRRLALPSPCHAMAFHVFARCCCFHSATTFVTPLTISFIHYEADFLFDIFLFRYCYFRYIADAFDIFATPLSPPLFFAYFHFRFRYFLHALFRC